MSDCPPNKTTQDQYNRQTSLASAVLSVATRVDNTKRYVPFEWKIIRSNPEMADRQFSISIVSEGDCQGFLFQASRGEKAQLLYEWQAKAKKEVRVPASCNLIWDGKDDSLLILVVVGDSYSIEHSIENEPPVYRGAGELSQKSPNGSSFAVSPVILDASIMGPLGT